MFFQRWSGRNNRNSTASRRPRFAPRVEPLETRDLLATPATLLVTTTADNGTGSLREAILKSNADGGGDKIVFNIAGGVQKIELKSALPTITAQVTIDGYGQGDVTLNN